MRTPLQALVRLYALMSFWAVAPGADLSTDLVAHWPLDVMEGTRTPDVVGGYDLEVVNLTPEDVVPGRIGGAFQFHSERQTLLRRFHAAEEPLPANRNANFTVAFWVKAPPGQKDRQVYGEGSAGSSTPAFILGANVGAPIDNYIRNNSGQTGGHKLSTKDVFDDTWHHVAWVHAAGVATLFVDGLADPATWDPRKPLTLNVTSIGGFQRASPAFWIDAEIDDLAIWKRALSPAEVFEVLSSGVPLVNTGPQPLAIRAFQSDLPAVAAGDLVTVRWDVSKDATVELTPGPGDVTAETVAGLGRVRVPVPVSRELMLTVRRGGEVLTRTLRVAAVSGVAAGWTLLDNFDRYALGPIRNTGVWADLAPNTLGVVEVLGNRVISPTGGSHLATLPLRDLAIREGQNRTLFFRLFGLGSAIEEVQLRVGLTDKGVRFPSDAIRDLGPFVDFSNDPGGAGLQMAAANGVLSPAERLDALLDRDAIYNVWIDVHNDTIQDGDRYSVHLQKEGVSGRMLVADGFVSDRSPEGSGVLGPTGPDLNALFVVTGSLQSATHNVLMDDFYVSRDGFLDTVPRAVGGTEPYFGVKEVPVLLRPRIEAGAIVFDFPGESGVTYRVERRAAGVDAGWEIVETRTGDGAEMTVVVPMNFPTAWLRIRAE